MKLSQAELNEFEFVKAITHSTIKSVYPHYYPSGAVEFFLKHHSDEKILDDVKNGNVYLLRDDSDEYIGTVTVIDNEITRLFVLPEYQHKGFGRMLMDHAEIVIAQNHKTIILHASLPAKNIYRRRGYVETGYNVIIAENGDYLCYDEMSKDISI